jgi:hypothetical protein
VLSAAASPTSHALKQRDGTQQFNMYSDTNCQNFVFGVSGSDNDNPQFEEYGLPGGYTGYIGSAYVVSAGTWTDTVYVDDTCVAYFGPCGASEQGPNECEHFGAGYNDIGCIEIGRNVEKISMGTLTCDATGFDNIYKK